MLPLSCPNFDKHMLFEAAHALLIQGRGVTHTKVGQSFMTLKGNRHGVPPQLGIATCQQAFLCSGRGQVRRPNALLMSELVKNSLEIEGVSDC